MAKQTATKTRAHKSDSFTFSEHIKELRLRLGFVALIFIVASSVAYNYHEQLVQIVMAPLHGEKLVYLTPGGGFSFIFQITLYAGMVVAAPALMHQIYGFLRPSLPSSARKSSISVASFATILMLVGVTYGYFVAIPSALTFLSTFAGTDIIPNLTADSYLSFFLAYIGGLALLFQLPLLLIFWHWIKPMSPGGLLKSERFIILFAFIAAALITPTPDVVNQAMIAVPLIAIYQLGVCVVLSIIWKNRKQQKQLSLERIKLGSQPAIIEPAPIVKPLFTQPVAQKPISTPRTAPISQVKRSLDGFSRPTTITRSAPRVTHTSPIRQPLATPQTTARSTYATRPIRRSFSLDGISPIS